MKKTKIAICVLAFLLSVCALYMLFSLLFVMTKPDAHIAQYGTVKAYFKLFSLVALGISAANAVFLIPRLSVYFKTVTHFVLLGAVLLLVIRASGRMTAQSSRWWLLPVVYAVLYAIIAPIVLITYTAIKKKKAADKSYESRFTKNAKKK